MIIEIQKIKLEYVEVLDRWKDYYKIVPVN